MVQSMSLCTVPTSLLQKPRLSEVQSWLEATQSYSTKIGGRDEPEPLFLKPWSGVCPPTPVPNLLFLLGARMCEQFHRRAAHQQVRDTTGDGKTPASQAPIPDIMEPRKADALSLSSPLPFSKTGQGEFGGVPSPPAIPELS